MLHATVCRSIQALRRLFNIEGVHIFQKGATSRPFDNKITYYKIKDFFTINHRRPIVLFIYSNNFNSEIFFFYLSFLIYIYKYIFI